ncbi:MAG: hypothetical protein WC303_02285, partial [Candidatus Paceibacterota bacterium]
MNDKDYFLSNFEMEKICSTNYENKANELAENFSKLEVKIASLLLPFLTYGFFSLSKEMINVIGGNKWILFVAWILMILSLVFGLINSHTKQSFWIEATKKSNSLISFYLKQIKKNTYSSEAIDVIKN